MRVVLYAEGTRETGGPFDRPPPMGALLLRDEHWGPAHFLVARAIAASRGVPEGAVQFESPRRVRGTKIAVGSDLLDPEILRQLLSWFPGPLPAPELAIFLVDRDGDAARKQVLEGHVATKPTRKTFGVAIEEFESWLIADHHALNEALGATVASPGDVESLARRRAKELLTQWCDLHQKDDRALRVTLAQSCALEEVARRCRAFATFLKELA